MYDVTKRNGFFCFLKDIRTSVGAFELSRPLEICLSQVLWMYIELEDALHWLSTLGGAFSNLGEHSQVR
jgi:hypothetical protein